MQEPAPQGSAPNDVMRQKLIPLAPSSASLQYYIRDTHVFLAKTTYQNAREAINARFL
jgi:hypothetical protein